LRTLAEKAHDAIAIGEGCAEALGEFSHERPSARREAVRIGE
jgi:hypothetical protein